MKTANLTDRASGSGKRNEKSATRSLAATLGFGKKDKAKPPAPAAAEAKATKTRRRYSLYTEQHSVYLFSIRFVLCGLYPIDIPLDIYVHMITGGSSVSECRRKQKVAFAGGNISSTAFQRQTDMHVIRLVVDIAAKNPLMKDRAFRIALGQERGEGSSV